MRADSKSTKFTSKSSTNPEPDAEEPPNFRAGSGRLAVALGAGLLVAVLLYVVAMLVDESYGPAIFATPFFIGVVTAVLCPRLPYRSGLFALALALLLAIFTMREGVVCVLFSLPLLIPAQLIGSWVGNVLARHVRSKRARHGAVSGFLFLGLLWHVVEGICDDPSRHPEHVAEAEVLVPSPPAVVFAVLTRGELLFRDDWPWFIRIGLPMPRSMSIRNPGPEAELRFDFGQGIAFGSIIRWRQDRELSYRIDRFQIEDPPFHITRLGRSPNYGFRSERVEDWLSVSSVRYSLEPFGEGGTRLVRRVVWRRHLAPGFYFGWLQQAVIERGQRRLLALIHEKVCAPKRPEAADARVSHLCTPVHTHQAAVEKSRRAEDGTIAAVGLVPAANRPNTDP
jgi:hypothetical protein